MPKPTTNPQPSLCNQWLTVSYRPVSLFSLRRSDATSMAARSNLVPTPYAIKMALLKGLLEGQGHQHQNDFDIWIKQSFTWIRDLQIHILPPERLVVNRNGYKQRYYDQTTDKADKSLPTMPIQDGFVFREWVFLEGNLKICVGPSDRLPELEELFSQIYSFGKRECFFQFLPDASEFTPEPTIEPVLQSGFVLQPMDDLAQKATFGRINPFSAENPRLNRDRVIHSGFLPLQLSNSGARYDLYLRHDDHLSVPGQNYASPAPPFDQR